MLTYISFFTIFLAGFSTLVIGAVWYGVLFGKVWKKLAKSNSKSAKGDMPINYFSALVTGLIQAYVLGQFMLYVGASSLQQALLVGLWLWVGFVASIKLSEVLFEGQSQKLYLIDSFYQLACMLTMSGILFVWK